ncbi:hypothetical protein SH139x_005241 [Planctomycetaceae bacterium SH139]
MSHPPDLPIDAPSDSPSDAPSDAPQNYCEPASEDALLDRFEHEWLTAASPPNLLDYCRWGAKSKQLPPPALLQLAMTDLEFRWRKGAGELPLTLTWYRQHLRQFGFGLVELEQLGSHELVVRCYWGDQPAIEDLVAEQFPDASAGAAEERTQAYLEKLDQAFPLTANVTVAGRHYFRCHLKSPCELGRRRTGEPHPPALLPPLNYPPHHRLLVADRQQNNVSRQQLLLRRVALDQVDITALSRNVGCHVGGCRLPVRQTVRCPIIPLGLEIRFHHVILHLRRV